MSGYLPVYADADKCDIAVMTRGNRVCITIGHTGRVEFLHEYETHTEAEASALGLISRITGIFGRRAKLVAAWRLFVLALTLR